MSFISTGEKRLGGGGGGGGWMETKFLCAIWSFLHIVFSENVSSALLNGQNCFLFRTKDTNRHSVPA